MTSAMSVRWSAEQSVNPYHRLFMKMDNTSLPSSPFGTRVCALALGGDRGPTDKHAQPDLCQSQPSITTFHPVVIATIDYINHTGKLDS